MAPFRKMSACLLPALACLVLAPGARSDEPRPVKVILLGIDGVSLNLLEPYQAQGVTPNLDKLAKQGGQGQLASFWPLRTMQVWTSIVTGKLPGQHGIWDHVKNSGFNPPGLRTRGRRIYTSADRRSKAMWQLLGEGDHQILTVGWPTTWPAERVQGSVMVAPRVLYGDPRSVTIKGSFWRHVSGTIQPVEMQPEVRKLFVEPQEITDQEIASMADVPPPDSPLYRLPNIKRYVYALLWNLARARSVEAVTLALAEQNRPEVVLAYFQCTDSMLHRFWIFQKPEREIRKRLAQFGIPTKRVGELKRRFGKVVENCYRDVDRRVGRILQRLQGDDTLVMVVSDHGFGDGPSKHPFRREPYGGIHWSNGILIAAGPGIAKGAKIEKVSVLDIAPTILHFLGMPLAHDMRGRTMEHIFDAAWRERHPVKWTPTYEDQAQQDVPYAQGFPPKPRSFVW